MGILSDFFIAVGAEPPDYQGGTGVPEEDRCQFNRITPLEAAGMLAILRGVDDRMGLLGSFPLLTPEGAEEWTMSVPGDMVELLAKLDPGEYPRIAAAFAEVTAEELCWTAEDFEPVVAGLSALAKRAAASGKNMFLWNSL